MLEQADNGPDEPVRGSRAWWEARHAVNEEWRAGTGVAIAERLASGGIAGAIPHPQRRIFTIQLSPAEAERLADILEQHGPLTDGPI